jgi:hypothetical protein
MKLGNKMGNWENCSGRSPYFQLLPQSLLKSTWRQYIATWFGGLDMLPFVVGLKTMKEACTNVLNLTLTRQIDA